MKTVMKRVYLVIALSLVTLTVYADTTSTQANSGNSSSAATNTSTTATANVLGNYQCQRADSASNAVPANLSVSKGTDTYTFEWDDSNGEPVLYGTGVMVGSLAKAVSVAFWDPKRPDVIGIEVFELKSDGSLQGNWTLQSDSNIGSETCARTKS